MARSLIPAEGACEWNGRCKHADPVFITRDLCSLCVRSSASQPPARRGSPPGRPFPRHQRFCARAVVTRRRPGTVEWARRAPVVPARPHRPYAPTAPATCTKTTADGTTQARFFLESLPSLCLLTSILRLSAHRTRGPHVFHPGRKGASGTSSARPSRDGPTIAHLLQRPTTPPVHTATSQCSPRIFAAVGFPLSPCCSFLLPPLSPSLPPPPPSPPPLPSCCPLCSSVLYPSQKPRPQHRLPAVRSPSAPRSASAPPASPAAALRTSWVDVRSPGRPTTRHSARGMHDLGEVDDDGRAHDLRAERGRPRAPLRGEPRMSTTLSGQGPEQPRFSRARGCRPSFSTTASSPSPPRDRADRGPTPTWRPLPCGLVGDRDDTGRDQGT